MTHAVPMAAPAVWRTLVEHSPAGIAITDPTGRPTYLNPTWIRYLGHQVSEVLEGEWRSVIHDADLPSFLERWYGARETASAASGDVRIRRWDGTYRWFTTTTAPVVRDDAVESWITLATDVDDRKRVEAALTASLVSLQQAHEASDEILGLISHELRAPLATIRANARVLAGHGATLPAALNLDAIGEIHLEADRLSMIIDNLLVLVRRGEVPTVDRVPVLLDRTTERIVMRHRAQARDRQFRLRMPEVRAMVDADPRQVEQILGNLLRNAERFGAPQLPIEVEVVTGDGEATVTVRDHGVGLSADELDRLFDPFFRSERTADRGGIGIGLAASRQLAEGMGGRLWADLPSGLGARFGLSLPLTRTDERDPD